MRPLTDEKVKPMPDSSSKLFSMATFFLSFWIVPGPLAYSPPASEPRGFPAVVGDRVYLAAGVTDKDEEASIGDPDVQAQIGDPGEQSTVGDPGEAATIGDPGEKAGISDPDEESTIGDPGQKSRF
jgi:hypothetical protein